MIEDALPANTTDQPLCCPWCAAGSGLLLTGEKPRAVFGDTTSRATLNDGDDVTELTEYQCRNEDCGRSFWI